ncbi:MAG: hypothetical protein H0T76_03630 [Nannocystis sp.]|nr:hypothetical protein [Nannocystis sp.]MBA3545552.1 hypothetical protein [Nannocystis sp.]
MAVVIKILGRHLLNPRPDFRCSARNFAAVALWPAGTVFAEVDGAIFVIGSPGGRFHRACVEGEQAELLRQHLRPVTAEDAVNAVLQDAPRWALDLLLGTRLRPREVGRMFAAALARRRGDEGPTRGPRGA